MMDDGRTIRLVLLAGAGVLAVSDRLCKCIINPSYYPYDNRTSCPTIEYLT